VRWTLERPTVEPRRNPALCALARPSRAVQAASMPTAVLGTAECSSPYKSFARSFNPSMTVSGSIGDCWKPCFR